MRRRVSAAQRARPTSSWFRAGCPAHSVHSSKTVRRVCRRFWAVVVLENSLAQLEHQPVAVESRAQVFPHPSPDLAHADRLDRSGLYLPRRGAQNEGSALFTPPRVLPALPRIGTPPPVRAPAFSRVPTSATRSPSRLPRPLEARYASFLESVPVVSSCTALPSGMTCLGASQK